MNFSSTVTNMATATGSSSGKVIKDSMKVTDNKVKVTEKAKVTEKTKVTTDKKATKESISSSNSHPSKPQKGDNMLAGKDTIVSPVSGAKIKKSVTSPSSSSMATATTTTGLDSDLPLQQQLRDTVARLSGELATERDLRREQSHTYQRNAEQQATKANLAAKELRAKLLAENKRELDLQRETLQRKHEQELSKATRARESEVSKLRAEVDKTRAQLAEFSGNGNSGLSSHTRHAFEAERSRLTAESQELRGQKRRLEDLVRTAQAAQRQIASELRQIKDVHAAEISKTRREADIEVKKLLEELKSKERTIGTLEKDTGVVQAAATIAKQQDLIVTMATEVAILKQEKRDSTNTSTIGDDVTEAGETAAMSESTDSAMSLGCSSVSSMSSSVAMDTLTIATTIVNNSNISPPGEMNGMMSMPPDPGTSPPSMKSLQDGHSLENGEQGKDAAEGETCEGPAYLQLTELRVKLRKTEEAVASITQDKTDVMKRLKDLEKKFKQSQEKNRKFLEKNMDVTNQNRNLEEKIKKAAEENIKTKAALEKNKKEMARLNNRLNHDKQGKIFIDGLTEEINLLREQIDEDNKVIEGLKLACEEKDRRIELLVHRRRKQRVMKQQQKVVRFVLPNEQQTETSKPKEQTKMMAAGIKETYYGYDEDSRSVDSVASSSSRGISLSASHVSLDNPTTPDYEDDVFDEFTRDEFEKNYQRLAKEHLELEKSFALLQSVNGQSHVDPQREGKLRSQLEDDLLDAQTRIEDLEKMVAEKGQQLMEQDTSWLEEKEKQNKAIRKLKEKISVEEEAKSRLKGKITELNEQNEVLEFRLLELEDCTEKLVEEVGAAVGGEGGRAGMNGGEVEEMAILDINNLQELKEGDHEGNNNMSERSVLHRSRVALDVTQRRVIQLTEERNALSQRLVLLEHSAAENVKELATSETNGEDAELVLEYEAVRNKLFAAEKTIASLTTQLAEEKQRSAVLAYKQDHSDLAEKRYRDEIVSLQRHLSSSSEGREHESELWQEKIEQLKLADATIHELQSERDQLQGTIKLDEQTIETLQEQLDTQSQTESDKDSAKATSSMDHSQTSLKEINAKLQEKLDQLKVRLEEAEHNEGELTDQNLTIQDELESMHKRCSILQHELEVTEDELETSHKKCNKLEREAELSNDKCASTERELQLACLAMEQLKSGGSDNVTVDFDSAEVLRRSTDEKRVLQNELRQLREDLDDKMRYIEELSRSNDEFAKDEEDLTYLKEHIELREQEIEELNLKAHKLHQAEIRSSEQVLELERVQEELEAQVLELKDQLKKEEEEKLRLKERQEIDEKERQRLQAQVDQLKVTNDDLQVNLTCLSANQSACNIPEHAQLTNEIAAYKGSILAEKKREENKDKVDEETLRRTIKELEEDLELARTQFEQAHEEFDRHDEELQKRIKTLEKQIVELQEENDDTLDVTLYEEKIEELEKNLQSAQENEKKLNEAELERDRRVKDLEDRLNAVQENEQKLNETIEDLKEMEMSLKEKIVESEMDVTEKEQYVEERNTLEQKVKDLEQQLKSSKEPGEMSDKLEKYEAKLSELVERVEELTVRESELMKQVYEHKMENQDLQDHLNEVLDGEKVADEENKKNSEDLKRQLTELSIENERLKNDVLKTKVDGLETLKDQEDVSDNLKVMTSSLQERIAELEKNEHDLKEHVRQANAEIETLNLQLKATGDKTKPLLDKIEFLELSEGRLMEQLEQAEERNERIIRDMDKLKQTHQTSVESDNIGMDNLLRDSKNREQELQAEIERLKKEMNDGLKVKGHDEVVQLREKVNILLDAEGKLVSRIQEQEEVEEELQEKIASLQRRLQQQESSNNAELKVEEEQKLRAEITKQRDELNRLGRCDIEQMGQITSLQGCLKEYERSAEELHDVVSKMKHVETTQKHRILQLEQSEKLLKTQLKALEASDAVVERPKTPQIVISSSDALAHDSSFASATGAAMDTSADISMMSMTTFVPLDTEQIHRMSREEMMSKIQELQSMEEYHRIKIRHLTDNLDELRNAVEVVAVTMETDAGIPVVKYRPKIKNSEFEARLQELVKSESSLKIRVIELEKKEMHMKRELNEAEAVLKEQERDYKDELDELEDELNELKKSEAKLKNKLQYGSQHPAEPESPALSKIQHLEELVCDLETAETKLKRKVQEAERNEQVLKEKLKQAENSIGERSKEKGETWEQKERHFTQEQKVQELTIKNAELEEELLVLKQDDNLDKLSKRVSQLQRTEKALRLKLDLLEQPCHSSLDLSSMMDTPEDLLRQRIQELNKLEQHQRQQVAELERDREELHEIARGDKNTIHELSVQVRELQLKDKSLKEQLNRCEQSESLLQLRCDDLTERVEDLEEKLRKTQISERSLRAQLAGVEHTHTTLSMKLEHSQEDLQTTESKLRKKIEELQNDKRELREKCDELTDRIGDLEGAEFQFKQKIRNIENNETQLKSRINQLETREKNLEQRKIDLENLNESLSEKIHSVEAEKSNMLFTMSELELTRDESGSEVANLTSKMAALERKLAESEKRKAELESRLDEFTSKEVTMQSRLGETERKGRELQESLEMKVKAEAKLKKKLEDLEAEYVATDEKVKSAAAFEKQLNFVRQQMEYHQRTKTQVEEENERLREKVKRYERASTEKTMVQIPSSELEMLRQQEKVLDDLESKVEKLEASEKSLKSAVEKLREGKAYDLLKENHSETKQEVSRLKTQLKKGGDDATTPKDPLSTSSKSVQARLVETINIKGLTPEFKTALKSLGARHPEAYEEFVHHLSAKPSSHHSSTPNTSYIRSATDHHNTMVKKDHRKEEAQPSQPTKTSEERAALISQLADAMSERPLWREVEGKMSSDPRGTQDEDYWQELEKNMGDTDDMMLTINFGEESDTSYPSRPQSAASVNTSSLSMPPPPLPGSLPPGRNQRRSLSPAGVDDSYYLPSADEASELEDDFNVEHAVPQRARSLEPDSGAYSESSSSRPARGTLPTLGMGIPPPKRGRGSGKRPQTASLDSIPDDSGFHDTEVKILKEKIVNLQEQVNVKENEVKMMKEELKGKDNNNETETLKAKLMDKENQLASEKRNSLEQSDKLSRTIHQLDQIKAEMDTLKAKTFLPPTPDKSISLNLQGAESDLPLLKAQLERKHKELVAKENEADRLSTELRRWQESCRDARDQKESAENKLQAVEEQLQDLEDKTHRLKELEEQYERLKREHEDLKARLHNLESAGEEKAALEKIVLKLRGQLGDLERIDLERGDLETKVKALEEQLKEKNKLEKQLAKDNAEMKHRLDELENENRDYSNMADDYNKVRSKFTEMEQLKTKAQMAITPLRAKVLRLAAKCKDKDEVLAELAATMHSGSGAPPADALSRADTIVAQSADDEYQRPISPLTAQALTDFQNECENTSLPPSPLLSQRPIPITHRSTPAAPPRARSSNPRRPHHSLETTSESDEMEDGNEDPLNFLSRQPVSQLSSSIPQQHSSPSRRVVANGHGARGYPNGAAGGRLVAPMAEVYRAIKDYQPEHFSRSGHQGLELPLKEGDMVKVLGPQDERGYFEAQVGGKVGLVPVSYVMALPNPPSRPTPAKRVTMQTRPHSIAGVDTSPEQILDMHQQLQRAHSHHHNVVISSPSIVHPAFARAFSPHTSPRHNGTPARHAPVAAPISAPSVSASPHTAVAPQRPLAPPVDLRIQRMVGDHSLLLSWTPPVLDELAQNNGTVVRGYKIYIDSKDRQSVPSPHMTKALVEKLDLRRPHSFSIQSIGESGRVSQLSDTVMFEDVLEEEEDEERARRRHEREEGMSIASTATTNTDYGPGERKVHVALYDYIPSPATPHPHQHLSFNAGDIVVTYGPARPDGLFNGKVQGKRGLVPASFIEEVAILKSKGRRSTTSASSSVTSSMLFTPPRTPSRHSVASSLSSTATNTSQQRRGIQHRV